MCGIAGIIGLNTSLNGRDFSNVELMTSVLKHRGPDMTGILNGKKCSLGNTRLKIIDLSDNASLPMANRDKSIWISYNGEVTNFKELNRQFKLDQKYQFQSHSDTEVLIYLYQELGIDCLKYLTGMFAFCLYDQKAGKVFLVRDFYGLRPVFYMIKEKRIFFASEIKSFLELPCFRDRLDMEGLYHYFTLAYIPGRHTPFKDIKELRGGEMLEIDLHRGEFKRKEYYKINYITDDSMDLNETARKLHDHMLDSVRRNLISDMPVGLTFSGGVDTSCILSLIKELGATEKFHTFSIKMNEPSFDESYYQKIMVDFARPIHHEITVNPEDVIENLIVHMAYMDEPHGDGAAIPFFMLAKEAKKYVSVLLSGEGGDEIFNAYETHGAFYLRKYYRKFFPIMLRAGIKKLAHKLPVAYSKLSFDFLLKRFTLGSELGIPEAHIFWRHVLTEKEKSDLMPEHSHYGRTDKIFRNLFDDLEFNDDLDKITVLDIKYYFIDDLLVKNDRMLMAHSIEARYPFMDRFLVEFMSRIPPEMRIKGIGFNRRYIEKKAMENLLPKQILRRKNMGLEMPHSIWFLDKLEPVVNKYFTKKNIDKTGTLNYEAVNHLWEKHKSRKKDYGRALWCILMYLIWFDLFVYNKDYKKYLGYNN